MERQRESTRVLVEFQHYLKQQIDRRRAEPGEDVLSDLVRARTEMGDGLTEAELIDVARVLLLAGHETTIHLLGNSVYTLLQHPAQLAAIKSDPGLIPNAVDGGGES